MKNIRTLLILAIALLSPILGSVQVASQATEPDTQAAPTSQVVLTSEIEWGPLNPARGDQSPKAGTLWGRGMHPLRPR